MLVAGVLLAGAGVLALFFTSAKGQSSPAFRLASVTREDLQTVISATGTVEPEELVDVGAQVAGKILSFGTDAAGKIVDYGSTVEVGTVLAKIDDALIAADVAQAEAQLGQATAALERTRADLLQLQAKSVQAERDWNRARKLGPSDALSQSAYDAALSAHDVAKANVAVGQAAIEQARKTVSQAEAVLRRARQNLDYCTIKSPVKGVIIDRRVNIGQTVVASLNAPSLFLIAKDLKRLQVWVAVNEADIGSIRPDQPVVFTVDAFPGETFEGKVGKVRLNATMTQNVVTYTVEVNTDNSNGRLLPYLTANVKFIVNERHNVLAVPNAALRWTPDAEKIAPENRGGPESERKAGTEAAGEKASGSGKAEGGRGTIWTPQGDFVRPVPVQTGLNDGIQTEVEGEGLNEGMRIVIGEQAKGTPSTAQTVNPFTPKLPGRGPRP
jgi:HlyD family secretion protein